MKIRTSISVFCLVAVSPFLMGNEVHHPAIPVAEKVIELLKRGDADGLYSLTSKKVQLGFEIAPISDLINFGELMEDVESRQKWVDANVDVERARKKIKGLGGNPEGMAIARAWRATISRKGRGEASGLWKKFLSEDYKETGRPFPMFVRRGERPQKTQTMVKFDWFDSKPALFYGEAIIPFIEEDGQWRIDDLQTRLDTDFILDGSMAESEAYHGIYNDRKGLMLLSGKKIDVWKMYVASDEKYIFFFLVVSPSVDRFYEKWLKSKIDNADVFKYSSGMRITVDLFSRERGKGNQLLASKEKSLRTSKKRTSSRIEMSINFVSGVRFSLNKKNSELEVAVAEQTREIEFEYRIPSEENGEGDVFPRPKFRTSDDERTFGAWSSKGVEFAVSLQDLGLSVGEKILISVEEDDLAGIRIVKGAPFSLK